MSKKSTIEDLQIKSDSIFQNKEIIILEVLKNNKLLIQTKYGICISYRNNLFRGHLPDISTSINKNEYFINKLKEIHGEKYDYSNIKYINNTTKINIICKIHGNFEQSPQSHLAGFGCKQCSYDILSEERSKTTKVFIEESLKTHGNKYNYNQVNYVNSWTKIDIICKTHGLFIQNPIKHLNGQGCPKCGRINTIAANKSSNEEFIQKCNKAHNNFYDYSLVNYTNIYDKIKIICPIHGEFEQEANIHLNQRSGCSKCAYILSSKRQKNNPTGWRYTFWENKGNISKSFNGFKIYILECWNEEEHFYKIGKTFQEVEKRFYGKNSIPYNYKIIKTYCKGAREISELENKLKNDNKEFKYIPKIQFGGMYECFKKLKNYEKFFIEQ